MSFEFRDNQKQIEQCHEKANRLWDELLQGMSERSLRACQIAFLPDIDIVETSTDYRLFLGIPGLLEDDIRIDVAEYRLTIQGERHAPYDLEKRSANLQEWRYGYFERTIELPLRMSISTVHANYEAGVLTVIVDKEFNRTEPDGEESE